MANPLVDHLSRGTFSFLRASPEEIRRLFPKGEDFLPEPKKIFLEQEKATPLLGFPILSSRSLNQLQEALGECLDAESKAQVAYCNREAFDSREYAARWQRYRKLLTHTLANVIASSHGRRFPSIFWLHHSLAVAQHLKNLPKQLLQTDLKTARQHGDTIKYRVFSKWIDRVVDASFDTAQELTGELDAHEDALFPSILALMRDNVLIFTEDHISPDISELASYFHGCLEIDGRDFRHRLKQLEGWLEQQLQRDRRLRSIVGDLLGEDLENARYLMSRTGFCRFLAGESSYDPDQLLSLEQVQVWEGLLFKLKEFEVLNALRRMMVPIEVEDGAMVSRDRSINTTWVGGPPELRLSSATRPLNFMAPGVVDPMVRRYGLVYDISDFSTILSILSRAERSALDQAFRTTFSFQRRVNKLAASLHLRLEKYLGDGAFYSGRNARNTLILALFVQRYYREVLEQGFPFDRGLRVAVNHGEYRLLPLDHGERQKQIRYEFFGQGLVELSRLSTGKKTQEIEDLKTYLITQGYPEATVNKFFAPMLHHNQELVSKQDEARAFYAYINQNNTLINEGMVATEPFIKRLDSFSELSYARVDGRGYIAFRLEDETVGELTIGARKLGVAHFKGLDPTPVYELVDGDLWTSPDVKPIPHRELMAALERLFASTVTRKARAGRPANR